MKNLAPQHMKHARALESAQTGGGLVRQDLELLLKMTIRAHLPTKQ